MTATRSIVAAGAIAFAGFSTAAFAEPKPPVTLAAVSMSSLSATTSAPAMTSDAQVYCVKGMLTGSDVPRKECHTKAHWVELGRVMPAAK